MATTLSNPSITSQLSTDIASASLSGNVNHRTSRSPSVGTAAGSVDLEVCRDFSLPTGTPLLLDLTSIADNAGNTVSFGHLTDFKVENFSIATGENIAIGAGTNGIFTLDPLPLYPNGGNKQFSAPNPGIAIDGTHKIFQLAAAAGTPSGRVTFFGRSV